MLYVLALLPVLLELFQSVQNYFLKRKEFYLVKHNLNFHKFVMDRLLLLLLLVVSLLLINQALRYSGQV